MVATANSFALLSAEQSKKSKSKNKKHKKKTQAPVGDVEDVYEKVEESEEATGQASEWEEEEFQSVRAPQNYKSTSNGSSVPSCQRLVDVLRDLNSAVTNGGDKYQIAEHWISQLGDQTRTHYADCDWSLTFRDVLAQSDALDRLVISFAHEAAIEDAHTLVTLLTAAAHPTLSGPLLSLPRMLAHVVTNAGTVNADGHQYPNLYVVDVIVATLKIVKAGKPSLTSNRNNSNANGGPPSSPLAPRTPTYIQEQQAQLARTTSLTEESHLASDIFQAACHNLTALQEEYAPKGSPSGIAFALHPLQALQDAVYSRLQLLNEAGFEAEVEARMNDATSSFLAHDAELCAQQHAAEDQVADLTRQLQEAQSQLAAVKARRHEALKEHEAQMMQLEELTQSCSGTAAEEANALELGLGALDDLERAIKALVVVPGLDGNQGSGSEERNTNVSSVEQSDLKEEVSAAASQLVQAAQQVQQTTLRLLSQHSEKAAFYGQRIQQATRQHTQLERLGETSAASELSKQRSALEASLQEVMDAAEHAVCSAQSIAQTCIHRCLQVPRPAAPPAATLDRLHTLTAQISAALTALHDRLSTSSAGIGSVESSSPRLATIPSSSNMTGTGTPPSTAGTSPHKYTTHMVHHPHGHIHIESGIASPDSATVVSVHSRSCSHDLGALEHKLAVLEEENKRKDAQIAAMLAQGVSVEVPSPLTALVSRC